MVFVGNRPYSLYLCNWPTFSFVDYYYYLSSPGVGVAVKVIITIIATLLTYRFVETPMRIWPIAPQRKFLVFGAFAVAAIALGTAGYTIRSYYYFSANCRNVATGGISINQDDAGE